MQVFSPIDGHAVTVYDQANATVNSLGAANFVTTDPDQTSVYKGFDLGVNARLPKGGRVFGGTTTERTLNNNCDIAIASPASLLYCDQANLGGGYTIPWKTQIKMAGTYPLPWFGIDRERGRTRVSRATRSATRRSDPRASEDVDLRHLPGHVCRGGLRGGQPDQPGADFHDPHGGARSVRT